MTSFAVSVTPSMSSAEISPQSMTRTSLDVLPDLLPCDSILWTTSSPSTTAPKTTCLPSSQSVLDVQMKNCEPLVPGPALACGDEMNDAYGMR